MKDKAPHPSPLPGGEGERLKSIEGQAIPHPGPLPGGEGERERHLTAEFAWGSFLVGMGRYISACMRPVLQYIR